MADAAKLLDVPAVAERQRWYTTAQAAAYLGTTPKALIRHVQRRNLVPDAWGGRGRLRSHRFLRETLDRFAAGGKAA